MAKGRGGLGAELLRRFERRGSRKALLRFALRRIIEEGWGEWAFLRAGSAALATGLRPCERSSLGSLGDHLGFPPGRFPGGRGRVLLRKETPPNTREVLDRFGLDRVRLLPLRARSELAGLLLWGRRRGARGRFSRASPEEVQALGVALALALETGERGGELLHQILNAWSLGAVLLEGGRPVFLNPVARRWLEVEGRGSPSLADLLGKERARRILANRGGGPRPTLCMPRGSRTFELGLSPLLLEGRELGLLLLLDVTERKALEARVRHKQKLEDLGRLASTLAHEFGNYLQVILGGTALAMLDLTTDPSSAFSHLERVQKTAQRASDLTDRLLVPSARSAEKLERVRLEGLLEGMRELTRSWEGQAIEVVLDIDRGLPPVRCHPGQIQQVLLNLVLNARDAMPEGGRLTLGLARSRERGWLELRVQDTGHGIPKRIRERIFDPYFTTKAANQGTGMGLSVVRSILEDNGGRLRLESRPGKGTCFRLLLPVEGRGGEAGRRRSREARA